jgi:hypothetical protein
VGAKGTKQTIFKQSRKLGVNNFYFHT